VALLAAVAVVAGIVAATGSSSPSPAGGSAAPSSGTATVQRRDLVQTDTESGTLSYANQQTVYNRMSGTITWLPNVGEVIKPGQALYKVDQEPVLLMDGTTPAYRSLNSSDSAGRDIRELNRNLVELGYNPAGIVLDDTWQAATTAGVDALQAALGETETGSLALGQIVFLHGEQVISAVEATVGSTGGSAGSGNSGTPASSRAAGTPPPEFVGLEAKPNPSTGFNNNTERLQALIALLKAEIAELKSGKGSPRGSGQPSSSSSGARGRSTSGSRGASSSSGTGNSGASNSGSGNSGGGNSGGGGGSASAILQTTSTHLIVTVDLDASKQSEAKVGEPVTVELPSGNAVDGQITAVSPVAENSSNSGNGSGNSGSGNSGSGNGNGNGSGSTIPVTIALERHLSGAGLDQAAVSVNFAQAEARNVLSVPVTALLARAGGGYSVQEAAAPHSLVAVTTGLFAAGYVQIAGQGIHPGLQVTDSQG
jgi:hypothetical protein